MENNVPFLQLTVTEAREVVEELEEALAAHRRWLKRFQTTLVCRTKPEKLDMREDSHLVGEFGRWYHRRANPYLKKHPLFATVGEHHRKMHSRARELAVKVARKEKIYADPYQNFAAAVDAFKHSLRSMFIQPREMLRYTDPLTGVANRYAMLRRLEQERERIKRMEEIGCVVLADLDHFKKVNDTHGHQAGDIVLCEAASFLQEHLRKYDQIYRYGGEEFLMLLPNTDPVKGRRTVDRLRTGLARLEIEIGRGTSLKVKASFGITELDPSQTVQAVIERADQALYAAKKAGRNRTCIWDEAGSA